ncbi:glycoside hydrolase family 16 protein [Arthrobacter psychrochitiniphilus]|uniref:glycoside hydrolase family 16 protein n=1 Tax=Arthrobacter psychrochitiniphilus TaxID=291045 RepID=UPI003F7C425D
MKIAAATLTAAMLVSLVPVIAANAAEPTYVKASTLLSDSMSRTVSNSWGKATSTIAYSGSNNALAVSGGTAKMSLPKPGKSMTTEANVKSTHADASYNFSIDKLPTKGSGLYSSLHLRHSSKGFYRAVVQVTPQGKTFLEVSRSNAGKITVLTKTSLPTTVKSGQKLNVELQVTGTSPVKVQAKVWAVGTATPSKWNLSVNDSAAARITSAGTVAVSGYLSGSSQASTLRYDDVKLSSMIVEPVKPAPTTPPTTPVAPPVAPPAVSDGYLKGWGEPAFRDEFNSNLAKWNVRNNDSLSYDSARIKAANVKVSDGLLHIEGKRQTVDGRDFTSGYIDSIGKFEQQYGRWEIRAKIPTTPGDSRGIWPAFWLRNSGVGEVDIMEAWGDPFDNPTKIGTSSLTVHESTNGGKARKGWNWETMAGTKVNSSADFHTWAIEYTPTELKGYFDNKLVVTATKAELPWLWGANFQTKFNMRLNLQIGSPYHGQPIGPNYKDTKSYSDFQIDYVRAWAYKG